MAQGTQAAIQRRWKTFALEYIKDFDAVRAYRECGVYKPKNEIVASAAVTRLLTNPNFSLILQQVIGERMTRLELDADKVVLEQLRIAMSDIRNYMEWGQDGEPILKPSERLTDDESRAIAEVKYTTTQTGGTFSFKLHNKQTALDSIFRHMGLYAADRKLDVTVETGVAVMPESIDAESWDVTSQKELSSGSESETEET